MQTEHDGVVEQLRSEHDVFVSNLRQNHQAEIDQLRQEHDDYVMVRSIHFIVSLVLLTCSVLFRN